MTEPNERPDGGPDRRRAVPLRPRTRGQKALALVVAAVVAGTVAVVGMSVLGEAATVPLGSRSFDAAYAAASCGDVITIPNGSVADQTIDEPPKACAADNPVVFQPATSGGVVTLAGFRVNQGAFIELRDLSVSSSTYLGCNCVNSGKPGNMVHHITYRRVKMRQFLIRGADDVSFIGGEVGPMSNGNMNWITAPFQSSDGVERVVMDGLRIHDFLADDSADHTDCIGIDDIDGFTFKNGRIETCQHFAIIFGNDNNSGRAARNVLLENSTFQCCTAGPGSNAPGFYSLGWGGIDGTVLVKGSQIPGAGMGWLNGTDLVPNGLITIDGNTIAHNNTANCPRATWRNNTVAEGKCPGDVAPTPTATSTATPTASPTATSTPSPTPTPSPSPAPTATPEPAYHPDCEPTCDQDLAAARAARDAARDQLARILSIVNE